MYFNVKVNILLFSHYMSFTNAIYKNVFVIFDAQVMWYLLRGLLKNSLDVWGIKALIINSSIILMKYILTLYILIIISLHKTLKNNSVTS